MARVGCAAHFARLAREAGISVREFGAPPDAGLACSAAVLRRRRVVGRCCRRQGQGRGDVLATSARVLARQLVLARASLACDGAPPRPWPKGARVLARAA